MRTRVTPNGAGSPDRTACARHPAMHLSFVLAALRCRRIVTKWIRTPARKTATINDVRIIFREGRNTPTRDERRETAAKNLALMRGAFASETKATVRRPGYTRTARGASFPWPREKEKPRPR